MGHGKQLNLTTLKFHCGLLICYKTEINTVDTLQTAVLLYCICTQSA